MVYCLTAPLVNVDLPSIQFSVNVYQLQSQGVLTHWGRVMHICVGNLTTIGSDNGLSPGRHQAIIWTNAGILLAGLVEKKLQWNFNQNPFIHENVFESVVCEMVAILSRPECVNWKALVLYISD